MPGGGLEVEKERVALKQEARMRTSRKIESSEWRLLNGEE